MNRLHRLFLFLLLFLPSISLNAQIEKEDTTGVEQKNVMSMVTDGLVTGVKYTEGKIKEVGKHINDIDTNYISPNLYNLAFMLEHSTWYEHYQLGTNRYDQTQKLNFSPNLGTYDGRASGMITSKNCKNGNLSGAVLFLQVSTFPNICLLCVALKSFE